MKPAIANPEVRCLGLQPKLEEDRKPAAPPAKRAGPANGLVTPLLLRNVLSSGLTRVLSGRSLSTPAPAVTIMEVKSPEALGFAHKHQSVH